MVRFNQVIKKLLKKSILLYQGVISPFIGTHCRFTPSCSHYCQQAIVQKGVIKGIGLTFWRLCRCHPFHPGGYDPVPSSKHKS